MQRKLDVNRSKGTVYIEKELLEETGEKLENCITLNKCLDASMIPHPFLYFTYFTLIQV